MYKYSILPDLITSTEAAITKPDCYGVSVYVDSDPDWVGEDIYIDPADAEAKAIFREFASKILAHYKTLLKDKS